MIIAVDIDGTITNGERFWCDEVTPDQEVLDKINKLYKQGHKIIYHTARHSEYYGQTYAWLVEHGAYFTALEMGKLTADVYVDDKALHVEDVDGLFDDADEEFDTEDIHIHPDDESTTVMEDATNCCGGHHQTIAGAMIRSREWQEWEHVAHEHGFDTGETKVIGHMSSDHWEAFVEFIKENYD